MKIKRIESHEANLVTDLFNKYRMFYRQPADLALARAYIKERLDKNESVIFVALVQNEEENIPVGFTQLYPNYSSVHAHKNWILNDLYVDKDSRKQGAGKLLIKSAMEFAKKDEALYIELSTAIDNFTAQGLYESIGFEKQEPDKNFFSYRMHL